MAAVSGLVVGAAFAFSAYDIIAWIIIGLIAGFLASKIMGGGGYGIVGDIVIGIVGAIIGGIIIDFFGLGQNYHLIGTIIVAIIGACILIAILRAISGGRGRARV